MWTQVSHLHLMEQEYIEHLHDRLWEEHCSMFCFCQKQTASQQNLSDTCQGWLNEFGDLVDRPDEPWMEYECHGSYWV